MVRKTLNCPFWLQNNLWLQRHLWIIVIKETFFAIFFRLIFKWYLITGLFTFVEIEFQQFQLPKNKWSLTLYSGVQLYNLAKTTERVSQSLISYILCIYVCMWKTSIAKMPCNYTCENSIILLDDHHEKMLK